MTTPVSSTPQNSPARDIPGQKRQLVIKANYELFVLAITLLQVVNAALWLFLRSNYEGRVVLLISLGISLFLLADCGYRLARAHDVRRFLFTYHGWLLGLGSLPIPFVAVLRW